MLAVLLLWLFSDPNQSAELLRRGLTALQQGQLVDARDDLEQASRLDARNAYVWSSLAETYLRLNQEKKASEAAQNAAKAGAGNPVVAHALKIFYFDYAQTLLRRGDFTPAADVVQSGLLLNPNDSQLTLALGVARYGQRRFEDAIMAFLKVIQIDPAVEQPYLFLGRMLDQAGTHLDEITQDYRKWAEREPQNAKAPLMLAKALLAADSKDVRAEALLRQSIALDANDWESHYELGVLLASKHDYADAAAELRRSTELDPKQAAPHYHLARVYDRLGQPEEAKAEREIHEKLAASAVSGMQ